LLLLWCPAAARAASEASFASAYSSVQSAFVGVHNAEARGGNVTSLVAQLDGALSLIQTASNENSSNPSQAGRDLQNATTIALSVEAAAPSVGQQGATARQAQFALSIGLAAVIVAVASALYVFGDRIYHRLWLRAYGGYLVKKVG